MDLIKDNMNEYKISVIMPVYNGEKFLDNSINSVINQSFGFNNIELIIIDDNSKDNSKKIIKKYAEKHVNIVPFFLDENHGLPSFGRNMGIDNASSDLIMFIDQDDEFDFKICEIFYNEMLESNVDLVCCDNNVIIDGVVQDEINSEINKKLFEKEDIYKFTSNLVVWNKIFRKSIIKKFNIKFPMSRNEDLYFSYKYIINSKKLIYLENYFGYNWIIREKHLGKYFTYNQMKNVLKMYSQLYDEIIAKNINHYFFFDEKFQRLSILDFGYPEVLNESKQDIYSLFEDFNALEKKIYYCFDLGFIVNIGKSLLLNRKFRLAFIYFKLLSYFRKI